MNYKVLLKVWLLLSISFVGFVITLTSIAVVNDITIITKPLETSIALSFVIPFTFLFVSGIMLLNKLEKRELKIS